jgi:diacylglycerol kinase (ATP)
LLLGGDGTIHHFLTQLIRAKLPVLIVPSGSENDFAGAVGIRSIQHAAELARNFTPGTSRLTAIDVGLIRDSEGRETPFCCVAGVGVDAIACEFANRLPRWMRSHGGYLLSAMRAVLAAPRLRLRICADQREIQQDSCLFSFANTPTFGGGLRIAPDAQLDDGKLDCELVDALLTGTQLRLKEVSDFRTEKIRLESNPTTFVYADGELVCRTPVEVLPRALRVICGA